MSDLITIQSLLCQRQSSNLPAHKTYVGIDFGTSTTVISIAHFNQSHNSVGVNAIPMAQLLEDGTRFTSEKIPTVIAWFDNAILVGEGADQLKYHLQSGKNIWYAFKMNLGEDLGAKYYESELRDKSPFNIRNPKDATRVFFMYLKILIERYCLEQGLSAHINYAITIPASFEANQRRELMEALEFNGMMLNNQSLIDEPNAAFLSYINETGESEHPLILSEGYNPKIMVFDFGGGTCDISLLEVGKNEKGIYSKNVAISKFAKLGGTDIDRYLAYHYLLPRFLEANNYTINDFKTPERKHIATRLFKIAENLKIRINKSISLMTDESYVIPDIRNSDKRTEVDMDVIVETRKGELRQSKFYLTNAELSECMKVFLKKSPFATKIKHEDDYNTIFMPIESVLDKANIDRDELDYILLIGGSSQSPYIQEALKLAFEDSELLVPQNLQTHVSAGAAIHSLLLNGMQRYMIQPITSEPILVITKDTTPMIVLPAGTTIPCDTILVDNLVTTRDKQSCIELPICVGNSSKMLYNLKITHPDGFPINSPVKLVFEINTDKLLLVQAECMGVRCAIDPQNPFANKELTTKDRIVLAAERQVNLEAEHNGGIPTKNSLSALRDAYIEVGNEFRAAETWELQNELYPSHSEYNGIGVLYANAGNSEKAQSCFKKAIQHTPNASYPYSNMGLEIKHKDPEQAKAYFEKALEVNPNQDVALIELGRMEQRLGKLEEANKKFEKAFEDYMQKWKGGNMSKADYGWFAAVARELGKHDLVLEIQSSKPSEKKEKHYEIDNLVETRQEPLDNQFKEIK